MAAPADFDSEALARPLAVVSCDGHIGPRLKEDLRAYCPQKYLARYDESLVNRDTMMSKLREAGGGLMGSPIDADGNPDPWGVRLANQLQTLNTTRGHYDIPTRLAEMDKDGVVAEVTYPGTHNMEGLPFTVGMMNADGGPEEMELAGVGFRMYNSWVADAARQADGRIVALVMPPLWDIDAAIKEVKTAHDAGLRAVWLMAERRGMLRYDRPEWEPFWSLCEDLGVSLHMHAGAPSDDDVIGMGSPSGIACMEIESGGWPIRRALHHLIFSGVFERHPKLKIAFTEINSEWWAASVREYDSTYLNHRSQLKAVMSRKPSEYMAENAFIGASFIAPFEADAAVDGGYSDNVMWGRDAYHIEGTFVVTDDDDPARNPGRMSMRYGLANLPPADIRKIVSDNAIAMLGLDPAWAAGVAARIGAPSLKELKTPIQAIPENGGILSFRTVGPWY